MKHYFVNIDFKNSKKTNLVVPIRQYGDKRDLTLFGISYQMSVIRNALLYIVYARLKKAGIDNNYEFAKYLKAFDIWIIHQMMKKGHIYDEYPDTTLDIWDDVYIMTPEQVIEYSKRLRNIAAKFVFTPIQSPKTPDIDLEDNLYFW